MKLSEILTGPETWCQEYQGIGARRNSGCLVWAVRRLEGDDSGIRRLERLIYGKNDWSLSSPGIRVGLWNDVPGRTWEEVSALVDAYDRDRLLHP